jgi:hypothetical protein
MASTRSKNTPGNYCLEQRAVQQGAAYLVDRDYAYATPTLMAGNGLLQGRMGNAVLAQNPQDVESFLFGINSTNLVTPAPSPFTAEILLHPAQKSMCSNICAVLVMVLLIISTGMDTNRTTRQSVGAPLFPDYPKDGTPLACYGLRMSMFFMWMEFTSLTKDTLA